MAEQWQNIPDKRVIAIAMDNSKYAEYAFDWYQDNIKRDGDSVVLIHVPEYLDLSLASPGVMEQLLAEAREKVQKLEDKCRTKVNNRFPAKFRTGGGGKPGQVILEIAKEEGAAMVITGTRGLGSVKRLLLGSVSNYILHHSHVPVLVCRKADD